jgi:hypothetical protein
VTETLTHKLVHGLPVCRGKRLVDADDFESDWLGEVRAAGGQRVLVRPECMVRDVAGFES